MRALLRNLNCRGRGVSTHESIRAKKLKFSHLLIGRFGPLHSLCVHVSYTRQIHTYLFPATS
jgi:hypothetical protein